MRLDFNRLVLGMLRAMLRMPKLQNLSIAFRIQSVKAVKDERGAKVPSRLCEVLRYEREWLADADLDVHSGGCGVTRYLLNEAFLDKADDFKWVGSEEVHNNLVELNHRLNGRSMFPY